MYQLNGVVKAVPQVYVILSESLLDKCTQMRRHNLPLPPSEPNPQVGFLPQRMHLGIAMPIQILIY